MAADRFIKMTGRRSAGLLLGFSLGALHAANCSGAIQVRSKEEYVTINPHKEQCIKIMGGDMERSGHAVQYASNTQEILKWCIRDINFNTFRVKYDKKQEMQEGVKTFDCYDLQVKTMQAIRRLNPDIKFLATCKSDYHGYGEGNCNNFPTFIYDYSAEKGADKKRFSSGSKAFDARKYGVFLADYVEYMHRKGVPIDFIATAKEYTAVVTPQRSHEAYKSMKHELFKRRVPMPQVIGPASWSVKQGIKYVEQVSALGYESDYGAFSSHDLNKQPELWPAFVEASAEAGKEAFNDESGTGSGGPIGDREPEIEGLLKLYKRKCTMYESGLIGEIFFEIWSRGISRESRAVYFPRKGKKAWRKRSYYVMKDFANSAVNTYYCRSAVGSSGVSSMVFRDDSTMHLWLVNESSEPVSDLKIYVAGEYIYHYLEHCYWDTDLILPERKKIPNRRSEAVSIELPAESLNYIRFKIKNR